MTQAGLDEALATLRRLRLSFDHTPHDLVWRQMLPLAMKHGLTVYDATYLELAIRNSCRWQRWMKVSPQPPAWRSSRFSLSAA